MLKIVHPVTGDTAWAPDHESAIVAQRTLRNDAVDYGVSPREGALIILNPDIEEAP